MASKPTLCLGFRVNGVSNPVNANFSAFHNNYGQFRTDGVSYNFKVKSGLWIDLKTDQIFRSWFFDESFLQTTLPVIIRVLQVPVLA